MTYSNPARRNLLATSPEEPMLALAEITHQDLAVPIRVVDDTQDIVVNGETFIACPFRITRPNDVDQQTPSADMSVDNVGRELTQWLEFSRGGKGAKIRIMSVLRSEPNTLQFNQLMDLTGLSIDNQTVDGNLGYQNTLMQPAVTKRFDPITAPGLY